MSLDLPIQDCCKYNHSQNKCVRWPDNDGHCYNGYCQKCVPVIAPIEKMVGGSSVGGSEMEYYLPWVIVIIVIIVVVLGYITLEYFQWFNLFGTA